MTGCYRVCAASLLSSVALASPCGTLKSRFSNDYIKIRSILKQEPSEIAIETEWPFAKVLPFVDTVDGRVGSLLQMASGGSIVDVHGNVIGHDARFVDLDPADRYQVFKYLLDNRTVSFVKDRRYHGLRFRDDVMVDFPALGPGQVPLSRLFQEDLRWDLPDRPDDLAYIESSMRGAFVASELNQSLWQLEDALGIGRRSHHIHNPRPIPVAMLKADPAGTTAEIVDFLLRANYAAEFVTIMDRGNPISRIMGPDGSMTIFGNLHPVDLTRVIDYLYAYTTPRRFAIRDSTKMSWVSFRGDDTYDRPDLMGLEFRSADRRGPENVVNELSDTIQYWTAHYPDGVDRRMFRQWWQAVKSSGDLRGTLLNAWYNQSWDALLSSFTARSGLTPTSAQTAEIKASYELRNLQAKMLFFDWSQTSVVAAHPEMKQRIFEYQNRVIQEILASNRISSLSNRGLVRDFLSQTGIADAVNNTLVIVPDRAFPSERQ